MSKKEFELSERSEFLNSRQLREAQGTRRVKWRGCPFLGSAFGQAKEERLLQANKIACKDEPSGSSETKRKIRDLLECISSRNEKRPPVVE